MSAQTKAPLTDEELTELDVFLLAGDNAERLPIDEVHGFLTALIVGNRPVAQAKWLAEVWGEPDLASEEKARMTDLMQRMYDDISTVLASTQPFEPLVIEEEEDNEIIEVYEGWCFGFMLGVANQQQLWEQLPKKEQDLLAPIATLACLRNDESEELDEEEYATCVDLLPGSVASLYAYWRSK